MSEEKKKKDEIEFGQGSNNAIIFNNTSARLTEQQMNIKIQLEARRAVQSSGRSTSRYKR